jgi:hypothetical protein
MFQHAKKKINNEKIILVLFFVFLKNTKNATLKLIIKVINNIKEDVVNCIYFITVNTLN